MKRREWSFSTVSKWSLGASVLALASLAVAGCGGTEAGDDNESSAQALVNGDTVSQTTENSLGLVAIYHHVKNGTDWFPRPCSGIIIKSEFDQVLGWTSWILTARHCLTKELTISGTPQDPKVFQVIPSINPGPATAGATPPGTLPVAEIDVPPPVEDSAFDLGLMRVQANWFSFVSTKRGLYMGQSADLVNHSVTSFGYGINVNSPCGETMTPPFESTGAGIARSGQFSIIGATAPQSGYSSIHLQNPNDSNQILICGDSGGPDLSLIGPFFGGLVSYIVGVHSAGSNGVPTSNPAVSAVPSLFVSDVLGGLFLKVDSESGKDLGAPGNVAAFSPSGTANTRFRINSFTKTIIDSSLGQCLGASGSAIQMQSCNGSTAQQWNYNLSTRQLINVATNTCIHDLITQSSSSAVLSTCGSVSNQRWTMSAQR